MYKIFYIMSKIHSRVRGSYQAYPTSREKDAEAPKIPEINNRIKTDYLRNEHRIRQNSPKIGIQYSLL